MKKFLTTLFLGLIVASLGACTLTPTRLTPDQSVRLEQAKADCNKASVFPKVQPANSRNQSGVRTTYFYDCMKKAGFVESGYAYSD